MGWLALACAGVCGAAAGSEPQRLDQFFARGVYWPWERTATNAAAAGKELWQFTDDLMAFLQTNMSVNVIWFVNGPSDPGRACDLAARRGIKVLCGALTHQHVHGITSPAELAAAAQKLVPLKGNPGLGAYVLKDEPRAHEAEYMETLRQQMAQFDPERDSIVVSMLHDTETYARCTRFPIVCMDVYAFGGPRSPNIANPASTSQHSYRECAEAMNGLAREAGKQGWLMPQAFADPWGPWWRDADGNVVIEPGTYWHWLMPTPAGIHWQTWEALRAGSRGVLWYVLLPPCNTWTPEQGEANMPAGMRKGAETSASNKWPLAKQRIVTGQPSDLLLPGGRPTPQSGAVASDFAWMTRHEALLMKLKPAPFPSLFAAGPAAVATFAADGEPDTRYAVVVNDDLEQPRDLPLALLPNVTAAVDLLDGQTLTLTPEALGAEGLLAATVKLPPGRGTLLKLTCRPGSQLALFREDFSNRNLCSVKLAGAERREERRGYSLGARWTVRKLPSADSMGSVTLADHAYIAGALRDAATGKTRVFLQAEGVFPKMESLVLNCKDSEGHGRWVKTTDHHLPVAIPPGTKSIELILQSESAALTGIRVWRVDTPEK